MALSLPATVVIITAVLFVISAVSVVLSIFSPASFFSSMPNSSINAPLVPEPSSRETTVIVPSAAPPCALSLLPQPANIPTATVIAKATANTFFIFISLLFFCFPFVYS